MSFSSFLVSIALALGVIGAAGALTRRLRAHVVDGLHAASCGLYSVECIRINEYLWAAVFAAGCAYLTHGWWHGGGGDGTRRRLRRFRGRFQGVRRTAPGAV